MVRTEFAVDRDQSDAKALDGRRAAMGEARSALLHATAGAHSRLHEHSDMAALGHGALRRPAYIALLLRLIGLHAPIEEQLATHRQTSWLGWTAHGGDASRATRLRADLAALGVSHVNIATAPSAGGLLPALDTQPAALGCAWVVEGSALGGRVLARGLGTILGADAGAGGSFFLSDPCQPERWRACCAAVEACGADPGRRAAMVEAAAHVFGVFETWLAPAR